MIRIISLLSLPLLSLATVFAANTPENIGNDLQLFKDASCTALKQDVKDTSAFQSDAMKELAGKILAGNYKPDYLYAEYRALPSPRQTGKNLRIGDGFSKYDNMTGVYLEKGQHVVLVGKTDDKITMAVTVNKLAQEKGLKAGALVKEIAAIAGGKGGGKPDSAMGGGTEVSKVDDALAAVDDLILSKLG